MAEDRGGKMKLRRTAFVVGLGIALSGCAATS
jgi:hypothetical protein